MYLKKYQKSYKIYSKIAILQWFFFNSYPILVDFNHKKIYELHNSTFQTFECSKNYS
jgi:hypothetical protein